MKQNLGIISIVVVGLLAAGCGRSEKHADNAAKNPVRVSVVEIDRLEGLSYSDIMGTVVARHRADIQTKVQARVERIAVSLGDKMREGDLLIEFDTRETRARVQQARAIHEQAEQDLKRFETLLGRNAVTQQEYDGVKTRQAVAAASLQEAEAMLTYARITAPFPGTITRKDINEGDLAVPGRPLLTLEDETSLQFVVAIPESQRGRLRVGDTLDVRGVENDDVIKAVVEEVSPSADPVSRSLSAKLALPKDDRLHAGQFARLLLPGEGETGTALPVNAVVHRGQLELVYAVTADNRASLKLVRTGRTLGDRIEILSGLSGGERIIKDPPASLGDHDPVEVLP